ncbi:MAG: Rha family transcriptional regulator [Desulfobacterium sp.]|nr:Rha family transcriptional regulator [Desulfobacterium sp.]
MGHQLVTVSDVNTPVTTSLKIAETFGKRHDNVMRNIATILRQSKGLKGGRLNFEESNYLNRQEKSQPMFEMDRDAFMLVVMGFTGETDDAIYREWSECTGNSCPNIPPDTRDTSRAS